MTPTVGVPCEDFAVTEDFKHNKHVMPADRDHSGSRLRTFELEPVGSKPEGADRPAEDLYSHAAAAEASAWTAFGMIDDPGLRVDRFRARRSVIDRIAFDRNAYLVGTAAVTLGLLIMVGAIWLYTYRSAPSHIAVDNRAAWCSGFAGLNCSTQDKAGKQK